MKDGKVSAEFKVTEDISNMSNGLHGGFTSSLIDTLCAFGLISHPRGALAFTTNIDVRCNIICYIIILNSLY